jgi:hypothetical protein
MSTPEYTNWHRSSYSNASGGNCIEVAWRKSTRSTGSGGACVEVAHSVEQVAVRDSKNAGPMISVTPGAWQRFLATTRA